MANQQTSFRNEQAQVEVRLIYGLFEVEDLRNGNKVLLGKGLDFFPTLTYLSREWYRALEQNVREHGWMYREAYFGDGTGYHEPRSVQ